MASIFSSITSPDWIGVWFFVEFVSIIVIAAGCAGELHAELHKFKDRVKTSPASERLTAKLSGEQIKERWKLFWAGIVVLGLSVELIAFGLSYLASTNEIEGLRKSNLELQIKLQPRTISKKSMDDFILLTEKMQKIPIKIAFVVGRSETVNFANQLRQMFTQAHFDTPTNSGPWGINTDRSAWRHEIIGDTNWTDVIFVINGTNDIGPILKIRVEKINGFSRPVWPETNNYVFVGALKDMFQQIGISCDWHHDTLSVGPGEFELVVMDKAN
jgi:hypothetical protein